MSAIERLRSALLHLDPSCSREQWVRFGMAAKSGGLSFGDFHEWSQNGDNYVSEKDCYSAWKSFGERGGITEATLYGAALRAGWHNPGKSRPDWNTQYEAANRYACSIFDRCLPVLLSHEYLLRKQGDNDGVYVYPDSEPSLVIGEANVAGYLVVPCFSKGQLETLQFISPNDGKKLNLPGASFGDGYFTVGDISDTIYLCEGIGQAWAVYQACGVAAVVCFGAMRMKRVAKVLRAEYSNIHLVIVPDRGMEALASKIAKDIAGCWVELPLGKPVNYDVNDYAQEYGYDTLANFLLDTEAPETRYKLLSAADLINAPAMRWMVRGVIPAEGLAALYGASGSGKSFLILDMACSIAAGDKYWFGYRVSQSPVTYVCLEGEVGMGKRVKAWSSYFSKSLPDGLHFITQPFDLLSDDVNELVKAVSAAGGAGGLIILDTLNRAAPGADENSSVDMGNIIAAAKQLQVLTGGLVLLVHHTGKDTTKGLRGHSSLYASLDSAIEVIKTDTRRQWAIAKSKDDITGDGCAFRLEIVQVGFDEEGGEISSCVALFDDSKEALQKKKANLGSNQQIALKVIKEMLNVSSYIGKESVPVGVRSVNYDEALALVTEQIPAAAKHRKTRASAAITGLVSKGYLAMKGDWLWGK